MGYRVDLIDSGSCDGSPFDPPATKYLDATASLADFFNHRVASLQTLSASEPVEKVTVFQVVGDLVKTPMGRDALQWSDNYER